MKSKIIFFATALALMVDGAFGINITTAGKQTFYPANEPGTNGHAGGFILAGCLGKSCTHGTHSDEWGVVGMIANTIVEHGAYFCPYQLQCANRRGKKSSWTVYYYPTGFSRSKCAWLCQPGYSGPNCMPNQGAPRACDTATHKSTAGGKFSGLSLRTSGGDSEGRESEIHGFAQYGTDPECDEVLGIVEYLDHGVMAMPVVACCGRDKWKSIDSFVNSLDRVNVPPVLLCAEGYTANSAGTDCVPISAEFCAAQNMNFCQAFPREGFKADEHYIDTSSGCVKYFCSKDGFAFTSASDTTCVRCSESVRGGQSAENGLCVQCSVGQAFDSKSGSCVSAAGYTSVDLQYGKGKTRNSSNSLESQCWTKTTADEYVECIKGVSTSN